MEFRALRVVVAIAEHGSVTRAAAALHQSSSAVSDSLLGLERELGVVLFHRLPRGMALSDAGEAFLTPARRALHEVEVARAATDAVRGLVSGHLTLMGIRAFSVSLADLVATFASEFPAVRVGVLPARSETRVIESVRAGECEIGFIHSGHAPSDLVATPIAVERIGIVVPVGHRLDGCGPVSLLELSGEPLVGPLPTSPMRPLFDHLFRSAQVEPRVVVEAGTHEMMLELVRAGIGSTISSVSGAGPVLGRGAALVDLVPLNEAIVVLVIRKEQQPTPAAHAFRDLAQLHFHRFPRTGQPDRSRS
jgi:DNA-binding transcriptional LysR family regulator